MHFSRTSLKILDATIVIGLLLSWFLFLGPTFLGGPASYIIVSGISMEPTLRDGELAILREQENYKQGDIVAFRVPSGLVIHRIVGGGPQEGFITQGDNKENTDPWQPRLGDILGKLWLHVPGGGRILQNLRQPHILIALGGLAALTLMEDPQKKLKNPHRRRGALVNNKITISGITAPLHYLVLLGTIIGLGLMLVALGIYSLLQPVEKSETITRLRYEHKATFNYVVHTEPSVLYPVNLIGPIGPSAGTLTDTIEVPHIFTRLAHAIDLDISYLLNASKLVEVSGELTPMLQIKAGEGWSRATPLAPPVQFTGPSASTRMTLDFAKVLSLIEAVEEQTGFTVGTYEVALIPSIRLDGQIGQEPIEDAFAPAFLMQINDTYISLDPELYRSETRALEEQVIRPQEIDMLGFAIPVATARLVGVVGGIIILAEAVLLFGFLFLGLGGRESDFIQVRYGSMLVSVSSVHLQTAQTVQVASIGDLVRLAQRDGRVILHQELDNGGNLYFVPDGQILYTYPVVESVEAS